MAANCLEACEPGNFAILDLFQSVAFVSIPGHFDFWHFFFNDLLPEICSYAPIKSNLFFVRAPISRFDLGDDETLLT